MRSRADVTYRYATDYVKASKTDKARFWMRWSQ